MSLNDDCISLTKLVYRYDLDQEPVVNIPQWQVPQGQHVFLRGESGSGKSTLIHLLAGLHSPTSGKVVINGCDLTNQTVQKRDRFRAKNIGLVYQQFNLIPYLSVLDNILLASHFSGSLNKETSLEAQQLLVKMNLPSELHNRDARNLSIGQQQRVAIVRAMINKPALVLVDEPTSALDSKNRDRFMELLFELINEYKATLVFVSHDEQLAKKFEDVVELSDLNQASIDVPVGEL